jgi:mono/diheme cytochrome c family protein
MRSALAALALLAAGCDVLDPMMVQQKVKLYRPSDYYDDGVPMRPPPAGTVAREDLFPPEVQTGLGPDGRPLARAPLPLSRESLELGRHHYEVVCAACHGLLGDGESPVARNMSLKAPPSLHLKVGNPDGYFYRVIAQGFGVMPSYAGHLTPEERWAVVGYLRALQLSQGTRAEKLGPAERALLEQGAKP